MCVYVRGYYGCASSCSYLRVWCVSVLVVRFSVRVCVLVLYLSSVYVCVDVRVLYYRLFVVSIDDLLVCVCV